MKIIRNQIIAITILIMELLALLLLLLFNRSLSMDQMSFLSVFQLVYNLIILRYLSNIPLISLPSGFLVLTFFFHCGQIIKLSFDIDGFVPLPFENYATMSIAQDAFLFYCFAQVMYIIGIVLHNDSSVNNDENIVNQPDNIKKYAHIFLLLGIGPRLYIDFASLLGALARGYEGVYSLYFPQFLQTLAFFFDAGLIFMLVGTKDNYKKHKLVFILTIIYKGLMMMSGSRQYNVVFLLVWIYLYAYILHRITLKKQLAVLGIGSLGFIFISMIGMFRSSNVVSLEDMSYFLDKFKLETILGNALGEYGSALTTLLVAVNYTPDTIPFGLGKSYIAGFFSIIPLLVAQIPSLQEATIFLIQLPKSVTFALGGSYLGELYYNFSWFGILLCVYFGNFLFKLHNALMYESDLMKKSWCAILGVLMLLFIRGYFTDMMQKLAWVYITMYLIRLYYNRKVRI